VSCSSRGIQFKETCPTFEGLDALDFGPVIRRVNKLEIAFIKVSKSLVEVIMYFEGNLQGVFSWRRSEGAVNLNKNSVGSQ